MDSFLQNLIKKEISRQQLTLDLIPSENVADPEMLKILGSPLANKYSEGYPGKRYYPGNVFYDEIEELAKKRALEAFKLDSKNWAVNVQPYSGSPANNAIYFALMKPGDVLMGLSLSHGGHLTHGHLVNFSGRIYQALPYELDLKTGRIDYGYLEKLAREHSPKVIVSGATAYPRKIDFKKIGEIARSVGAYHVADISHIGGLVAAGVHPSSFPHAEVVMTTMHKTLRGPRGAVIFSRKLPLKSQIPTNNFQTNPKPQTPNPKPTIADMIDKAVFPGLQGGPHNNQTAAIAWTFGEVKSKKFKVYGEQVVKNAKELAKGLMAHGFDLVSGGTDNHLMLMDLRHQGMTGMEAEKALEESGIIANRNTVPGDLKPFNPSGVRLGTPAVTSRGMKEKEMGQIARFIHECLLKRKNVKKEVEEMCKKFPLPY